MMGKHSLTREEAREVLGLQVRSAVYTLLCAWLVCGVSGGVAGAPLCALAGFRVKGVLVGHQCLQTEYCSTIRPQGVRDPSLQRW